MKLSFEYGHGMMEADFPDQTDVFIPGETVLDPPFIPFENLEEETRKSIRNPIGMSPISMLAGPGKKAVIVFPDRVKGGFQETSHRKVAIPIIIEELLAAGVDKKDIRLICSNGLHRKNKKEEIKMILGDKVFNEFWNSGQISNHDSEDKDNLIDLGCDEEGDRVIMNKTVFEADIPIFVGHVLGNPYGGYSGGYKHCATGITNWQSISAHHNTTVMHSHDFTPVSSKSVMRHKFDTISMHMESKMGRKFFCCDAVLDTNSNQIAVISGYAYETQPYCYEIADKRTYIHWADKKYDIMVFGMPQMFHYGNGMGTNPILMLQAISAQIVRHKRVLSDHCVVICSSICNGYFHDEEFPSYRETYELFQKDYNNTLPDIEKFSEYFATNEEYIRQYRYNFAYHPFHAFSMTSCGHIAEKNCAAIYIVGAQEPGYARGMGMKTRSTFEEAIEDATKKYCIGKPNILALPKAFKTASVHLCMKKQK